MSIQVYTWNLDYVGQIDTVESMEMTRTWNDSGTFSFQTDKQLIPGGSLQTNYFITFQNDPHRAGIIRSIYQNEGDTVGVTVSGETLNGLLSQRLNLQPQSPEIAALNYGYDLVPQYTSKNEKLNDLPCESILKTYVQRHCVETTDPFRKIQHLQIATDKQRGRLTKWMAKNGDVLLDTLKTISEYSNLGFEITLDAKERAIIFDIILGNSPPVFFSPDYYDVISMGYRQSTEGNKNIGYAAGMTYDDLSRLQITVTAEQTVPEGIDRREVFLDCGGLSLSETNENISLQSEGEHRIADYMTEDAVELKIAPNYQYVYGQDYDIGDIVKVCSRRLGISVDRKITSVTERLSTSGLEIDLTLGSLQSTFANSVKRLIKNS